jgi:hypothetical protein
LRQSGDGLERLVIAISGRRMAMEGKIMPPALFFALLDVLKDRHSHGRPCIQADCARFDTPR